MRAKILRYIPNNFHRQQSNTTTYDGFYAIRNLPWRLGVIVQTVQLGQDLGGNWYPIARRRGLEVGQPVFQRPNVVGIADRRSVRERYGMDPLAPVRPGLFQQVLLAVL